MISSISIGYGIVLSALVMESFYQHWLWNIVMVDNLTLKAIHLPWRTQGFHIPSWTQPWDRTMPSWTQPWDRTMPSWTQPWGRTEMYCIEQFYQHWLWSIVRVDNLTLKAIHLPWRTQGFHIPSWTQPWGRIETWYSF